MRPTRLTLSPLTADLMLGAGGAVAVVALLSDYFTDPAAVQIGPLQIIAAVGGLIVFAIGWRSRGQQPIDDNPSHRFGGWMQALWVTACAIPISLTFAIAARDFRPWLQVNYVLIGITAVGFVIVGLLARSGRSVNWVVSIAVLILFPLTPELILRQTGFHYESGVEFGYPRPTDFVLLESDPDLFWRFRRGELDVNSWGFNDDEFEVPKPPQRYRILFLSDSVASLSETTPNYPEVLVQKLNDRLGSDSCIEAANLSVPGYSSYQGRRLVDLYGETLDPDLVITAYGWNDHWTAYGSIDSEKAAQPVSGPVDLRGDVYHASRILQWMYQFVPVVREPLDQVRVPPDEYRANLADIGGFFDQRQVPVLYLSAPTSFGWDGVPEFVMQEGFAADASRAADLHQQYAEITIETAQSQGWLWFDLAEAVESNADREAVFYADGIHLTPRGIDMVAGIVADTILDSVFEGQVPAVCLTAQP